MLSETCIVYQSYAETPTVQLYFAVQGHREPDPLPACIGQEAGKHWTGQVSNKRAIINMLD